MSTSHQNKHVFTEIYVSYTDPIFRYCYFKVNDRELAKDMLQQSFMQLWSYMKNGESIENPKALLYRIAGNLVVDWYRKKKAESLDALTDAGLEPVSIVMGVDEIERSAEINNMFKMLNKIDENDQNYIIWRYVEDMSPAEIALMLGERENTVSVKIHRAVERLKKHLLV
ncbi:MAG TPA: sigma-70 family RNA polymerase sigma factor [Candidatus Paceibacterota bacterium]